jgi:hypothetical protein
VRRESKLVRGSGYGPIDAEPERPALWVRVKSGSVLYRHGRCYRVGQEVRVAHHDAERLIREGSAEEVC